MSPNPISGVRGKSATVGFQRRLEIPAIDPGAELQYDVDTSPDIQALLRRFGSANYLQVVNLDEEPVEVRPDYVRGRALYAPGGSVVVEDDTMFQSFNIVNVGNATTTAGRVKIIFGVVRPGAKSAPIDGARRWY